MVKHWAHLFFCFLWPTQPENKEITKKLDIANTLKKVKEKHPNLSGNVDEILDRIKPGGIPYKALYDFEAQQDGDLPFREDDRIYVTKMDGDWWEGECNGKFGTFPNNYVAPV